MDLRTGERTLRKARQVPGYDPAAYRTERRHATAADGTAVPVTLAWRADTPLDGTAPCVMWGYGAYESCDDPEFDEGLASLLDRGVVFALTHPRGGGEMGRGWWLDGRLERKANTFSDHIAVADWLAGEGLVDGSRIGTRGLSAGGLLQGVVFSVRPDRWRAVVAEVPFVDVVNTMLDPSIPLTINEWDEWGDPREPDAFAVPAGLLAVRERPARPAPGDAGDGRGARPAGHGARAGEVGRATAARPRRRATATCCCGSSWARVPTLDRRDGMPTTGTRPRSSRSCSTS